MTVTTTPRGVLRNPHLHPAAVRSGSSVGVRAFHRSMAGYRPTPLVEAPTLARRLGVASVSVKDESSRLGLPSFKILGASWATFRVLAQWVGARPDDVGGLDGLATAVRGSDLTLVAATDGNHGRAVARMAQLLGLQAHILVPHDMVAARIDAIRGEGAAVTIVDGTYDDAVARSAALAGDKHVVVSDTSWPGYVDVPSWVIDGYATIVEEVLEDAARRQAGPPTVVAAQMGVGAFALAMVRGFLPLGARIIGAEPTKAACVLESLRAGRPVAVEGALDSIMAGLNCGTPSPLAWPELQAGLDAAVAVADEDAEDAMRALAEAAVVSGESGAAGLAALLAFGSALDLQPDDRVLIVSTEGATDPAGYRRAVAGTAQTPGASAPGHHEPEA